MFAEAGFVLTGFILCVSVPGHKVHGQVKSICALKGSSAELLCTADNPLSSLKWYTNDSAGVLTEISADGSNPMYKSTKVSNFTLTINNLKESDAKSYCCTEEPGNQESCWLSRTELSLTDLQVKVIPSTVGPTVTLMCSSSCRLTETPAAYVWYRNREFLYEDWSPWYQELVSSDKAVAYSCAVKGYEDLRAPEVSVDSVTSACFMVTYAKGRMCSHHMEPEDKPCYITFPRGIYVSISYKNRFTTLTCESSCPISGPQTAYRWYWNSELNSDCESRDVTTLTDDPNAVSCAIKGHEDLLSNNACISRSAGDICWRVNYDSRRICALEGSSVKISSESSLPLSYNYNPQMWHKTSRHAEISEILTKKNEKMEFEDPERNHHILRINDVNKNDSATYSYTHISWRNARLSGVLLVVTGLKVTMTPSVVVTEGQRVTLTCTTSCPLTEDAVYTWYMSGEPLMPLQKQSKHLLLDPVTFENAGNYSCAVLSSQSVRSAEEKLAVLARGRSALIIFAVRLTVFLLMLTAPLVLYLWMRKKKNLTSTATFSHKVQTGQMVSLRTYENIALRPMNPAAQAEQELQ